jgi:UDP-N-acetyl-2-amino-2-deoxyglucuronate dehydrogenase
MFMEKTEHLLEFRQMVGPVNDLWTIPGEEHLLKEWIKEDTNKFNKCDPTIEYIKYQIEDFLSAIGQNREPYVNGEAGRKTVELFTAIYRSSRDNKVIKFPLIPEPGLDGRQGL